MKHFCYNKLEKICVSFAGLIFGGILLYLLLMSMNSTSICYEGEHTYYLQDSPVMHILCILVMIGIIRVCKNKLPVTITPGFLKIYMLVVTALMALFVLMTQFEPISDQEEVMLAAKQFLMGNYSAWEPGGYAFYWKHQNGIILIMALVLSLIGTYNYVGLQLINVALLAVSMFLIYRVMSRFSEKKNNGNAVAIAIFLYVPFWFYVTFIYGTLIGFAAMMASIWFTFRYMDNGKWPDAFGAACFVAVAVTAKSNYYIMLIAVVIVLVIKLVSANWKRALTLMLLMAVFVTGAGRIVDGVVSANIGKEVPQGPPAEVWVAMGLSEGWLAPGWINGMSDYIYRDSGYDREMTRWAGRNYIRQFVERAEKEQGYAQSFFTKKTASQWNNPVFECFQLLEDRNTKVSIPAWLQRFINTGTFSNRILTGIFNYVQTLILFGALLYLILSVRKIRMEEMLFGIIFIGGFLFHMFWEACCTYTIPYFVLLIPYSVNGYLEISDKISDFGMREKRSLAKPILFLVVFGMLVLGSGSYFSKILPNDNVKYQQYLAGLNQVTLKNGSYIIAPANSDNTVIGLYEDESVDGASVGVVWKDEGRNQRICLARVRDINDFDKYKNLTSTYYMWLEQNQFYLSWKDENDSVVSRKLKEEDSFLWRLERAGEGLYYIYSSDGRVLEYSPINGVLFFNEKDGSNEYQVWRISESN